MRITDPGGFVDPESLRDLRAKAFTAFLDNPLNACFQFKGCSLNEEVDCVHFVVEPDIPTAPVVAGFQYEEPLIACFRPDLIVPVVLSGRADFPQVPHLHLTPIGCAKSLCLFGEDPHMIQMRWTPSLLGERILWWFSQNARGTLHRPEQGLEPFLSGVIRPIILPKELVETQTEQRVNVYYATPRPNTLIYLADLPERVPEDLRAKPAALLYFDLPAQEHGVIRVEPQTLAQLIDLCEKAGYDLLGELKAKIRQRVGSGPEDYQGTFLILKIPLKRNAASEAETYDVKAFECSVQDNNRLSPGELGRVLGFLAYSGGSYLPLLQPSAANTRSIRTKMLSPYLVLNPAEAAQASGIAPFDGKVVALGLGSLGSQVFALLVRQGFGRWTLVDEDFFQPHNIVRHQIFARRWGLPKAQEMARSANEIFGCQIAKAITADILEPGPTRDQILSDCQDAHFILDMTASTPVRRDIAKVDYGEARRVSAFFTPDGQNLVYMAEDSDRKIPIHSIEAQYVRAILNDPALADHLPPQDSVYAYGGTCRDLSSRISPELVAIHCSHVARSLRATTSDPTAALFVTHCDPVTLETSKHTVPLRRAVSLKPNDWQVVLDEGLLEKLHSFRASKLPNETCGVLLGDLDIGNRTIYLIDALSAPVDSTEEADACQRGIEGLADAVAEAEQRTWSQLTYVGEWHSHPDQSSCMPSARDLIQLEWIAERMYPAGKPALILILCEHGDYSLICLEPGAPIPEADKQV